MSATVVPHRGIAVHGFVPCLTGSGASSYGQCRGHGDEDHSLLPAHPRKHRTHSACGVRTAAATGRVVERRSPECSCSTLLTRSSAISSRSMRLSTQTRRGAPVFGGVREAGLLATALQRHAGATFTWEAPLLCCSVLAQSGALKAESTPMRVPEPSGRIGPTCAHERFERLFLRQGPNPSIERTVTSGLRPLVTAAHVKR